jgi:hypothetical protein
VTAPPVATEDCWLAVDLDGFIWLNDDAMAASLNDKSNRTQISHCENEKALEHLCSRALRLVRLAGIEPTTPWFVVNKGNEFTIASNTSFFLQLYINQ